MARVILWIFTAALSLAAEEKQAIAGHMYGVLSTADGVKLEPGVCPGGDHPHVVKTQDGKLVLLLESHLAQKGVPVVLEEFFTLF